VLVYYTDIKEVLSKQCNIRTSTVPFHCSTLYSNTPHTSP
jgi:hypothetical protein